MKTLSVGLALSSLVSLILPVSAETVPAWWTSGVTSFYSAPSNSEYSAPINVGQLKHVATQAKRYLENVYGVIDWDWAYQGCDMDTVNPLKNSPFPFAPSDEDYAIVNVGQLKAVAYGFYKVLNHFGHPVEKNIEDYLGVSGLCDGFYVPWESVPTANTSPANVGQCLLVFAFWPNRDLDLDNMPDYWEIQHFDGSLTRDGTGDFDGDGILDRDEYPLGLDPNHNDQPSGAVTYVYDAEGRLTSASNGVGIVPDVEGNLTAISIP
jgi:hypothetical protein